VEQTSKRQKAGKALRATVHGEDLMDSVRRHYPWVREDACIGDETLDPDRSLALLDGDNPLHVDVWREVFDVAPASRAANIVHL